MTVWYRIYVNFAALIVVLLMLSFFEATAFSPMVVIRSKNWRVQERRAEFRKQRAGRVSFFQSADNNEVVDAPQTPSPAATTGNTTSMVEQCFDAFNRRDLEGMLACFADNCQYEDTMFQSKAVGKRELKNRFERAMYTFPGSVEIVTDQIAFDPVTGKIGAQWHLQDSNIGNQLRFTRGCSFYTTNRDTGLIATGFRVMETPFKPDDLIFNALNLPLKLLETLSPSPTTKASSTSPNQEFDSIVEQMFDGWNRRDMDAAVECFTNDVTLIDTLYIQPIQGREALRQHFSRVANQVPRICEIQVDDIAVCPTTGNVGVIWHLEAGSGGGEGGVDNNSPFQKILEGWSRGCSMYTTDAGTGLLKSGIDITEAPIKINEPRLDTLLTPFKLLFRDQL
mmetsp:Transcript_2555/g.3404  ORF Transcript_2555/g.3404 Transcript_2555/m.3404 type:complete len:395 (+) Transcript_2555:106-1290(+)|eukprot:CAMPEP_0198137530 /NCGR_PEP_ID=MMETSP1443-20131203/999_1 /TAXON_ID=186043 /ORGANISM="Entomoneis sp., Strain CCMP2396" /LENGTH=394 /DNA_ID=CAMNT_0043798983 /DNA_START=73 /DNA_END=1257 /DNA_ORIENTATION=-